MRADATVPVPPTGPKPPTGKVRPTEPKARTGKEAPTGKAPPGGSTAAQLAYTSYLRVVAIGAVVLIHTAGLTYGNKELRGSGAGVWWVASLATFSTKWAVPLFVMVSGALLLAPPVNRSAALFFRRRLSRIGIPLVVWHVVYITIAATILTTSPQPRRILARLLRGESFTGLYFFWLILGLYLITPLLWPVVASLSRRAVGVVGVLLVATAALNQSTLQVIGRLEGGSRPAGDPTLFTQFLPYVGFFILGYAVRDVVVRGTGRVLALAALTAALCLELTWQVTGPFVFGKGAAGYLNTLMPVSYQGWVLGAAAVAMFVLVHSVVHPGSRWAAPRAARWARYAGDLTLGVYATHLAVLIVLLRIPGLDWRSGAETLPELFALCGGVLLGATILTVVIKQIPLLRRSV